MADTPGPPTISAQEQHHDTRSALPHMWDKAMSGPGQTVVDPSSAKGWTWVPSTIAGAQAATIIDDDDDYDSPITLAPVSGNGTAAHVDELKARGDGWMPFDELPYHPPAGQQCVPIVFTDGRRGYATPSHSHYTTDALPGSTWQGPFGWFRWRSKFEGEAERLLQAAIDKQKADELTQAGFNLTALRRLRAQEYAKQQMRAKDADEIPDGVSLSTLLVTEFDPVRYRIEQMWPADGRVVCAAAAKTGKTTLVSNIIRALVDDVPFLGVYKTIPVANRVVVIDNEMSPAMLKEWYADVGIDNSLYVQFYTLRGQGSAFDILNPEVRAEWVSKLKYGGGTDVLILDCLTPALGALGLTESNEDVNQFLIAFDALKHEAGIGETLIMHHMGHESERSRGGSRLLDWPDANWRYVRERTEDDVTVETGARFISAYGRDVDVSESKLTYDPLLRRLSFAGGTRQQDASERHIPTVVAIVAEHEPAGIGATDLKREVGERCEISREPAQRAVVRAAERRCEIYTDGKQGTKKVYHLPRRG